MPTAFPAFYSVANAAAGMMSAAATVAGTGISAAGFGAAGIAKGSIAAFMQSLVGNMSAGSLFSMLQSFGAVGGFQFMILIGLCGTLLSYLLSFGITSLSTTGSLFSMLPSFGSFGAGGGYSYMTIMGYGGMFLSFLLLFLAFINYTIIDLSSTASLYSWFRSFVMDVESGLEWMLLGLGGLLLSFF